MKALIAMSGGVDSSVSALLVKNKGYDCIGTTMRLYTGGELDVNVESSCCSLDDVNDAKRVCDTLSMPHYTLNFSERFEQDVIAKFIDCYENGITPNPCIYCNRYLKFEHLFRRSIELECDYIVTGHYARIEKNAKTGRYELKKAVYLPKDQSYVLYSMTQEQLAHTMFPLGEMTKDEARKMAEENNLINARKRESQDICFVPDGDYAKFIEEYTNKTYKEGYFIDTEGNVLGTHKGIIRYTVGQRKGLGLALNEPMYVKDVNVNDNTVTLARDCELFSRELKANDINLISIAEITEPIRVYAKIRYRHKEAPATVYKIDDDKIRVVFDEPQRAITKGQAVVLYDYDDCDTVIGGGTIFDF